MVGTVKFYNAEKGFGFIQADGEDDVFFHMSGLKSNYKNPKQGDNVDFSIGEGKKGGTAAVQIEKL